MSSNLNISMKRPDDPYRHEHELLIDGSQDEWAFSLVHSHEINGPNHTHEIAAGPAYVMARQDI